MKPLIGIPTRTLPSENLVFHSLSSTYTRAVELGGGAPVLIPLRLGEETLRAIFARLDGLLLPGGVDIHPSEFGETVQPYCGDIDTERDAVELRLIRWALKEKKPTFGICRGIQMLNVAAGGSLYQDIPAQLPDALNHSHVKGEPYNRRTHSIEIEPASRLARLLGETHQVNSLHHQSLKQVAKGFRVIARAPDGVIEGIEAEGDQFALGVQFHPEWLVDDDAQMVKLMQEFVSACTS